MKQNYFSKLFYGLCLFVLISCQSQATPPAAIPTTVPTIAPTDATIVYQAGIPDITKNIGEIVATIPLKSEEISMVYGFGAIWVAHPRDGVVARIDLATNTIVAEIKVGVPTGNDYYPVPGGLTVTSDRVWTSVTNAISNDKNGQSKLVGIDPATNEIVEEIPLGSVKYPQITLPFKTAWAITNDDNTLWVGDFYQGVVLPVDIQSKQVIATIMQVDHVTELVPFDNSIWAVLHRTDGIARIDLSTNTIIATIPLPLEEHGPSDICSWCVNGMAVGDGNVWVSLGLAKAIAKIDPETNQAVTRINFEGYVSPFYYQGDLWITVSPEECNDSGGHQGYLTRLDLKTNILVGKIPLDCPGGIILGDDSLWVGTVSESNAFSLVRINPNP